MTKYWTTIANMTPLNTKLFPRLALTSVNHRIAPINTIITEEILPMNIRNSQISIKYDAIKFVKSARGLKISNDIIGFTLFKCIKLEFKHVIEL